MSASFHSSLARHCLQTALLSNAAGQRRGGCRLFHAKELAPVMMSILIAGALGRLWRRKSLDARYQEIDALRTMNINPFTIGAAAPGGHRHRAAAPGDFRHPRGWLGARSCVVSTDGSRFLRRIFSSSGRGGSQGRG